MNNEIKPVISLCIPTNGISEWVFPVLDSIYEQGVDESLFEVIVTNNGKNEEFHKAMLEYSQRYENLIYNRNKIYMFGNQMQALLFANGDYFKFINHRNRLVPGALQKLIDIVTENKEKKPVMYFSNGVFDRDYLDMHSFDEFVYNLASFNSWTTGVGIWKDTYEKLSLDAIIEDICPHFCILYADRNNTSYKIYNHVFSEEVDSDKTKKGSYDFYKAFGIEEITSILQLYLSGDISADTFKKVKKDFRIFLSRSYWEFQIKKEPCSYDMTGLNNACGFFFSKGSVILGAYIYGIKQFFRKFGFK